MRPRFDQPLGEDQLRRAVPIVLVVVLIAWCAPALDQYNVTWDEALGDFFFGDRYLSFFTSFDPVYLDFAADPYPEDRHPDLRRSPFRNRPWEHYPVASTLAALSSKVLSGWLGLVDAFDGFHAVNIVLAALLLWTWVRFLDPRFGTIAATAAVVFLFSSPRIFSHLMANVKDFPLMVFFTLTIIVFFRAYESGSRRGILAAGALWGLALGTKANALFLPLIPLALIVLGGLPETWRQRRQQLFWTLVGAGFAGVIVMVMVWPYLWADPLGRLVENLEFVLLRKDTTHPDSFAPVVQAILLTTPPAFLACFAIGLIPCLRMAWRDRRRDALLLLVWIPAVLSRYLVPQAVNYDGVRHFLELFPAMAAIAGLGVAWLGRAVLAGLRRWPGTRHNEVSESAARWIRVGALALALAPGVWSMLVTHPFQLAYWNVFTGGYAGARARDLPQAGDYWGTSYRLGMRWLNDNAPQDAWVAVPVIEHAVRLVAPDRLRPDLVLLPVTTPFSPQIHPERLQLTREAARQRPVYVMFVERRDWMNELMRDCLEHLEPEVEWVLNGEPVLAIYRYIPP